MTMDNRIVWESLGMDLGRHDQLLAVLPQVFSQVYLGQPSRPEGMAYFDQVVADIHGLRVKELLEHKSRGGKVFASFCIYVPEEIVYAAGAACIGLCGGTDFPIGTAERVLPRNLCPLIKSSVGFKLERICPYFEVADLVVGETTCDGKKKAWEVLSEHIPMYVMELPQKKGARDLEFWEEELWAFLGKVQEVTRRKIGEEDLRRGVEVADRKREALARLFELRKADPVPISGLDALLVVQLGFFDDPLRFAGKVEELCRELEERAKEGMGAFPEPRPRILISGSPMAIPNWKLHALVEGLGGAVVCEESCTGSRALTGRTEPLGGGLEGWIRGIARRQLRANCACFTPNWERVEDVLRLSREYSVDGVILYTLQFCQPFLLEAYRLERILRGEGIPVLRIETDYGQGDEEALKLRIKGFLESLGP